MADLKVSAGAASVAPIDRDETARPQRPAEGGNPEQALLGEEPSLTRSVANRAGISYRLW